MSRREYRIHFNLFQKICGKGIAIQLQFSEANLRILHFLVEGILFSVAFYFPFWTSYVLEAFSPSPFALRYSVTTEEVNSSYGTVIIAILKPVLQPRKLRQREIAWGHTYCFSIKCLSALKVCKTFALPFLLPLHPPDACSIRKPLSSHH